MAIIMKSRGQYMTKNEHGRTGISPIAGDAFRYESIEAAKAEMGRYLGIRKESEVEFIEVVAAQPAPAPAARARWTALDRFNDEPNNPLDHTL